MRPVSRLEGEAAAEVALNVGVQGLEDGAVHALLVVNVLRRQGLQTMVQLSHKRRREGGGVDFDDGSQKPLQPKRPPGGRGLM